MAKMGRPVFCEISIASSTVGSLCPLADTETAKHVAAAKIGTNRLRLMINPLMKANRNNIPY
jgi:hypothetical protein